MQMPKFDAENKAWEPKKEPKAKATLSCQTPEKKN